MLILLNNEIKQEIKNRSIAINKTICQYLEKHFLINFLSMPRWFMVDYFKTEYARNDFKIEKTTDNSLDINFADVYNPFCKYIILDNFVLYKLIKESEIFGYRLDIYISLKSSAMDIIRLQQVKNKFKHKNIS